MSDVSNRRTNVQKAAFGFGVLFLVVTLLGFIPGITTGIYPMAFAGHEGNDYLLGVFQISVLHNAVHWLYGVAGVVMSRTVKNARSYLIGGGLLYLLIWLYGVLVDNDHSSNFVPLNTADQFLHFFLGVVMIALGYLLTRGRRSDTLNA